MGFGLGGAIGSIVGGATGIPVAGSLLGAAIGSQFDKDGNRIQGSSGYGYSRPNIAVDMGQLRQAFQQVLGREPSRAEVDHFSKYIKEGALDMMEVSEILGGLPEAQQARIPQQAQQLSGYLQPLDERSLQMGGDTLAQRFASQGRQLTGSSYTQAYMNAARDLALARQGQMANFIGQGLSGVNQAYAQQAQGARGRGYGLTDERRQREYQIEDYYRQKQDYDAYNEQARRDAREQAAIQAGVGLVGAGMSGAASMFGGAGGLGALRGVAQTAPMISAGTAPQVQGVGGGMLPQGYYPKTGAYSYRNDFSRPMY